MIYRTMREGELPQWAAHCQEVFRDEDASYFRRHYEADPFADPSWVFIAADGETIVSTVRVFRRAVWICGQRVEMGGIGEVSTKPAYRGKGLAGELLRRAIAQMTARSVPVSILFGDRPMYAAAGWQGCATPMLTLRTESLPALDAPVAVRPFAQEDLPAVMGMYDLYAGRLDGAVIRTEAYWRQWVLPQWRSPHVLWQAGRPVAYACAHALPDGQLEIGELCATPQGEALLTGFLRALAEDARTASIRCPSALLPEDAPGERARHNTSMMVRLNRPWGQWESTEALVRAMDSPGMFAVDDF